MKKQEAETRRTLRKAKKDSWKAFSKTLNQTTPQKIIWNKIKAFKNKALATSQLITQQDHKDSALKKDFIDTFGFNSSKLSLSQELTDTINNLQTHQVDNGNSTIHRGNTSNPPLTTHTPHSNY